MREKIIWVDVITTVGITRCGTRMENDFFSALHTSGTFAASHDTTL